MSNTDLVTETDQAVEKMLIENLSKEFPDHKLAFTTTSKILWMLPKCNALEHFVGAIVSRL